MTLLNINKIPGTAARKATERRESEQTAREIKQYRAHCATEERYHLKCLDLAESLKELVKHPNIKRIYGSVIISRAKEDHEVLGCVYTDESKDGGFTRHWYNELILRSDGFYERSEVDHWPNCSDIGKKVSDEYNGDSLSLPVRYKEVAERFDLTKKDVAKLKSKLYRLK